MANQLKLIVGKLNQKKDLEETIPAYVSEAAKCYHRYAKVRLAMEYYMSYEEEAEALNQHRSLAKESYALVHEAIGALHAQDFGKMRKTWIECLCGMRKDIMQVMDALTAYVDTFALYEYIYNRLQYRYEEIPEPVSDDTLTREIVDFIFSTKDNVVVSQNIHTVLGQLPVRMAKGKYFDMVKDSLSMYKGVPKENLDSYLYMFRTSAMLYQPAYEGEMFSAFAAVREELAAVNYATLTKEQYEYYVEKIALQAQDLKEISDVYMSLEQIINNLLGVLYAEEIMMEKGLSCLPKEEFADRILQGVCALYTKKASAVWEKSDEELSTDEEKLGYLSSLFGEVEGLQEEDQESLYLVEAMLDESMQSFAEQISQADCEGAFTYLRSLEKLMSSSIFIELEEEKEQEIVTEAQLQAVTQELLAELETLFAKHGRHMKRAVMAATIEKMPLFFGTAQEVADYVYAALSSCTDQAEKYALAKIVREMF